MQPPDLTRPPAGHGCEPAAGQAVLPTRRGGQSLIEILVAVGVGVVLITAALAIISPTMKTQGNVTQTQVASALGKELLDGVQVMAEGNWHSLDGLATTSANRYYLVTSSSPYTATSGTQSVLLTTTTYTRYFYVEDVRRNTQGKIDDAGTVLDPSTKKVTIIYSWGKVTSTMVNYFTRARSRTFMQTEWSGGAGQEGPLTSTSSLAKFSTSSNISYATSTGSLVIQGISGP